MTDHDQDLQRASRGDRDALRRVIEVWWPRMRRWALVSCGDVVLAEDAVQDALVRVIRSIRSYDPARPFGPWLKTIVVHVCHDQARAHGRRWDAGEGATTGDPGRVLDIKRAARVATERFADLSPRQREVIQRVDVDGMSGADVARELNLSPGAVRAHLHNARKALRAELLARADILPLLREA